MATAKYAFTPTENQLKEIRKAVRASKRYIPKLTIDEFISYSVDRTILEYQNKAFVSSYMFFRGETEAEF